MSEFYHRKLYTILRDSTGNTGSKICKHLIFPEIEGLNEWWENQGYKADAVGSSSDRVNLHLRTISGNDTELRHPISGEPRVIPSATQPSPQEVATKIRQAFELIRNGQKPEEDTIRLFWWCWRFYPQLLARESSESETALLNPAHRIIPDCPQHSYNSTVSALVGAMFPQDWQKDDSHQHPYLLIFTFSPVQEFIKSSRKFLDFWGGSYLLHYLSAILCWRVAEMYGPDAVITPSLWSQEIIDALIVKHYPEFKSQFEEYEGNDPATKFSNHQAQSLCTAGFPNIIIAVVPSKEKAIALGKELDQRLKNHWYEISYKVRQHVKDTVISLFGENNQVNADKLEKVWKEIKDDFKSNEESNPYQTQLKQFAQPGCWEFNKLWDAQINHTWESYFVAVPLGSPDKGLEVVTNPWNQENQEWVNWQKQVTQSRTEIPTSAERQVYDTLNVGSWWGSCQARLGGAIQAIKNTRGWQIPVAPGERSTLSGQYSALHPRLLYQSFQDGLGLPTDSLRLFWRVMATAYPGVFNGSEKLNAIELTKRLAWKHGGVAENLGIELNQENDDNYEGLIRFPNLCSIAAAHFATHYPQRIENYWLELRREIFNHLNLHHDKFCSRTRRPFQVRRADAALRENTNYGNGYNGVMFSSKWLADDMSLNASETSTLRTVVDTVQTRHFGDSSPADWWVLVLGDGDGMGDYVSGSKLKNYENYIIEDLVDRTHINESNWLELLKETKKRMGPATHVGLNRALLDFSNRLVPYITEQRFCGRVIYSGGDDVMAVLSLADLPGYLQSLRAAWCGANDPEGKFSSDGGYWKWQDEETIPQDIPRRPLFTMGKEATMSLGVVIAYKSVPLPTVLENIWEAEKERAKKLLDKDGLCFRVIYGSGNTLEALMKGHLLEDWWKFIQVDEDVDLSPLLYRLADELPRRAEITEGYRLFSKVAKVVISSRDERIPEGVEMALIKWLDAWEEWAYNVQQRAKQNETQALGATPEDMAMLLRFSAFLVSRK